MNYKKLKSKININPLEIHKLYRNKKIQDYKIKMSKKMNKQKWNLNTERANMKQVLQIKRMIQSLILLRPYAFKMEELILFFLIKLV